LENIPEGEYQLMSSGEIYEKEENVEEKGRWRKYSQRQNWKDKDKINAK
jgi:hypothetical protein